MAAEAAKCLFSDVYEGTRKRPCNLCKARHKPFSAMCWETRSRCEWWAAETGGGGAVFFRAFPNAKTLPQTAKARLAYVKIEYQQEMDQARRTMAPGGRFHFRPALGMIWEVARVNALFSRLAKKARRFRPACACEVAAWLAGHKDDFLAVRNQDKLMYELERYV